MRRLTLVLGAVLVAACGWGTSNPPSGDASSTPNRLGQTFIIPTPPPTPDTSVAPADVSAWLMVAPVGQGFGVAMPAQPAASSGSLGAPPVATTFWTYTDPSNRTFQVARSRLPTLPPTPEPRSNEPAPSPSETPGLTEYQDTVLQSLEGSSFVSGSEANVDGRPGLRYVIQAGNRRSEGLLVLDKPKDPSRVHPILYRVSVTYDADRADPPAVLGFLDSFTLMPPRSP